MRNPNHKLKTINLKIGWYYRDSCSLSAMVSPFKPRFMKYTIITLPTKGRRTQLTDTSNTFYNRHKCPSVARVAGCGQGRVFQWHDRLATNSTWPTGSWLNCKSSCQTEPVLCRGCPKLYALSSWRGSPTRCKILKKRKMLNQSGIKKRKKRKSRTSVGEFVGKA